MSPSPEGIRRGARNAFISLALGVFFLLLAIPANRDMERLLIGVGVIMVLIALGFTGFLVAERRRVIAPRESGSPDA